jgi:hypothetical protein
MPGVHDAASPPEQSILGRITAFFCLCIRKHHACPLCLRRASHLYGRDSGTGIDTKRYPIATGLCLTMEMEVTGSTKTGSWVKCTSRVSRLARQPPVISDSKVMNCSASCLYRRGPVAFLEARH